MAVPTPASATVRVPPCRRTIAATIARPSPALMSGVPDPDGRARPRETRTIVAHGDRDRASRPAADDADSGRRACVAPRCRAGCSRLVRAACDRRARTAGRPGASSVIAAHRSVRSDASRVPTSSSTSTGCMSGRNVPASMRLMLNRFATNRSRRSVSSIMMSSSSLRVASSYAVPDRKSVATACIAESGVRRSCDTERNSARRCVVDVVQRVHLRGHERARDERHRAEHDERDDILAEADAQRAEWRQRET